MNESHYIIIIVITRSYYYLHHIQEKIYFHMFPHSKSYISILSLHLISFLLLNLSLCSQQVMNESSLIIGIEYDPEYSNSTSSNSSLEIALVYSDNSLNNSFYIDENVLDCGNYNLFVLNQTSKNSNYTWVIANYNEQLTVQVSIGYYNSKQYNLICYPPSCAISLDSNCTDQYENNLVTGIIQTSSGNFITSFKYYYQCNIEQYLRKITIQWGFAIITIVSIFIICISSKFQQAHSFHNYALYVNYVAIGIYCALCLAKFLLLFFKIPYVIMVINYVCITSSFIFGTLSVMVCFCQLMYYLQITKIQEGIKINGVKIRIMDVIGFVLGAGLLCAWYFLNRNVIISDIVFVMMYLSLMKFVKFQSLKMLLILFALNFTIICSFYYTVSEIDSSYDNNNIIYFNNPLFLLFPNITHIPNSKCAWYSLISMSYGGFFLCYLERFDKNKSSVIYSLTFIASYTIGSVIWLILSIFTPFLVLYQLFTIPVTVILLVYFAFRRGQLTKLWNGEFYDQQNMSNKQQVSKFLLQSDHQIRDSFRSSLLNNLKYDSGEKGASMEIVNSTPHSNEIKPVLLQLSQVEDNKQVDLINQSSSLDVDSIRPGTLNLDEQKQLKRQN